MIRSSSPNCSSDVAELSGSISNGGEGDVAIVIAAEGAAAAAAAAAAVFSASAVCEDVRAAASSLTHSLRSHAESAASSRAQ